MKNINLRKLRKIISSHFNKNDIIKLAFDLELNYENILNDTADIFALELINECRRHNKLDELVALCQTERPSLDWKIVYVQKAQTYNQSGTHLNSPNESTPEQQQTEKRSLTLQNPDFIFVSSAYGKNGMGNPQIYIDITAHFLLKANLFYGNYSNQSLSIRTVNNMGQPQKIITINPKYKFQTSGDLVISHLPDMLFTVLIRGYSPEHELRVVCLSLLGDKLAQLIDIVKDKRSFNTGACETEILYEGNDLPKGADLTNLSRDFRYNINQINLELGSAQKINSRQSFLGKIFGFK